MEKKEKYLGRDDDRIIFDEKLGRTIVESRDDLKYEKSDKQKIGKKSRAAGKAFEKKVREDLIKQGWIVTKWSNKVQFNEKVRLPEEEIVKFGQLIPAKAQYNPFFKRIVGEGSGFPDFLCIRIVLAHFKENNQIDAILVESKMAGKLDQAEQEQAKWIIDNLHIPIIIASKGEKRGEIVYTPWK